MKNMNNIRLLTILVFLGLGLFAACASAQEVDRVPKEAFLVDVRTTGEFDRGSYPGAVNIPLQELEARISEFGEKDREIIVFCRSGNRSGQAKTILKDAGYTNVKNGGGLKEMLKLDKTPTSP